MLLTNILKKARKGRAFPKILRKIFYGASTVQKRLSASFSGLPPSLLIWLVIFLRGSRSSSREYLESSAPIVPSTHQECRLHPRGLASALLRLQPRLKLCSGIPACFRFLMSCFSACSRWFWDDCTDLSAVSVKPKVHFKTWNRNPAWWWRLLRWMPH